MGIGTVKHQTPDDTDYVHGEHRRAAHDDYRDEH
jgi:hypothetical protein